MKMKKIFMSIICAVFLFAGIASADGGTIKNFYGYTIVGQNVDDVAATLDNVLKQYSTEEVHYVPGVKYTYFSTDKTKESYFVRLYPSFKNTNVYIVSNASYDKQSNAATEFFKAHGYKYAKLEDKDALREYKFDFYDLARKNTFEGFFIAPDCVKPLKIGMKKLNDKMAKNNKKTSVIAYAPDNDPIDLTCIDMQTYKSEDAGVYVIRKEYRLKQKENKYVHAFEYVLRNNLSTPMVVKQVTSERVAGIKDVTTEAFVDLDKLDLVDTVGSFPPVVLLTAGTSLLCSVPNWVRLAKITKESVRYTKALPSNYTVNAGAKMRILVLKYKNDPKPLHFVITRDSGEYTFSF